MTRDANSTVNNEQILEEQMNIPEELLILTLKEQVAFPTLNMTLAVQAEATSLIEEAMKGDRIIGAVGIRNPVDDQSMTKRVFETGTVIRILYATRASDNTTLLVARGLERFRIDQWLSEKPYLKARITLAPEITEMDVETDALFRSLRGLSQEVFSLMPNIPKEAVDGLASIRDPLHLAYIAAAHADIDFQKRQNLLEEDSLKVKLRESVAILSREKEVLALGKKIQTEAQDEMNKTQREYYLRQQLEAIKKELGESDGETSESDEYRQRIEKSDMSAEARKEALRELDRFAQMTPQSAEYSLIKTYLDWLLDLPWNQLSDDQADIKVAREILDEDHYGLQEVKDRLIEYLAVRNLLKIRGPKKNKEPKAPFSTAMGVILCFAGPPGVGKTSLGQSIARAMGREFTRMSLGGIRDEAEIRGHRRTYIGAMPGRIIQAIKRAGTRNPVFMLDEVDKIGSDWRGDPSSALLEVLDPAQNATFRDHYLDVDFDLSDVIFIATANQLESIPVALRDRLEIIQLEGYTEFEKIQIAKRHLIPRQLTSHGLIDSEMTFMDETIRKIISSYTREAGVRQLERLIGAVCRKCVVNLTTHGWSHVIVTPEQVTEFLKKEKFENELSEVIDVPGVATGLAVTANGGDILYVEATRMHGDGQLNLTGQLGDVMKESAQIAYSYIRAQAEKLAIESQAFDNREVHLHVPAGAIPKDGPSAGIAMTMALASLFSNRPVRSDVGMTGEITLRGRILPVGGIKMKILAAHRAGLTTVILPKRNARDLDDVPEEIRNAMQFILVDRIDEAIDIGLTRSENSAKGDYRSIDRNLNPFNEGISALDSPNR
ncbi:MAG: endopeptidase La [Desulfobacterales bacterium]|jgi:ATP-dependent Lon protease